MTRRLVYGFGLLLAVVSTALTIASIIIPRWASFGANGQRNDTIGLHRRWRSITGKFEKFPTQTDCIKDQEFCSMWRTVGFLFSFEVVLELCALSAFIVVISGGVQRRVAGWKVVCSILLLGGVVQCTGMAIMAYLFNNDKRFFEGWYLDTSFYLSTVSWIILVLTSFGITASALYLEEEGGYELIPNLPPQTYQDDVLTSRIARWNDGYQERN